MHEHGRVKKFAFATLKDQDTPVPVADVSAASFKSRGGFRKAIRHRLAT